MVSMEDGGMSRAVRDGMMVSYSEYMKGWNSEDDEEIIK